MVYCSYYDSNWKTEERVRNNEDDRSLDAVRILVFQGEEIYTADRGLNIV